MITRTGTARAVTGGAFLVCVIAVALSLWSALTEFMVDLQVFQDAGRAFLSGADLYSDDFPTRSGLRFIYPPVAAMLFVPLAYLDSTVVQLLWTTATVVSVWAILAMVSVRVGLRAPRRTALAMTGVALLMEPVRANLGFGQINVFLFLMVTADVLGFTPRRVRGVLLGLAAGIKITPAAFGILFLVRRDWWSLGRSVATVALTVAVGWLVRPADSMYFWTAEFFKTDRGGESLYVANQALSGLAARAGLAEAVYEPLVYLWFLVAAVAAIWGARRFTEAGRPVDAMLVVALAVFTATPVAVAHHWSGIIIVLPLLLAARGTANRVALAVLVIALLAGAHNFYPALGDHGVPPVIKWFVGNSLGLTGLIAFLVLLALAARLPSTRAPDRRRGFSGGTTGLTGAVS